ncbi:multiprotein-bridging factor 1 family protein [Azospirillum argentinense]|uniref:Multiprotein-bridging factor 1 family protein n=1 Tax=Azospirillum argentinense TaxID=2970906 RepID=A0ABW8VD64_9PROT
MTPLQCKAARQRLGWSIEELAHRALRSHTVFGEFERGKKPASAAVLASLHRTFVEAGVNAEAIPTDAGDETEDAACSQ